MISFPPLCAVSVTIGREAVAVVVLLVDAIAVGGFDEQVVRLRDRRRVRQDRPAEAPEVAAEHNGAAVNPHAHVRGAEQVSRVDELRFDAVRDRHRPIVAARLQLRHGAERVDFGIERQRRLVLREVVAVRERGVFFLQASGIGQHDLAEILRAQRAEHAAAEALRDEPRQVAAVIQVRVGQDDGLEARGGNRQILPVPQAELLQALEQPGIHHDAGAVRFHQVLGTRDGPRRSEKRHRDHLPLPYLLPSASSASSEESNLPAGMPEEDRPGAEVARPDPRDEPGHRLGRIRRVEEQRLAPGAQLGRFR